MGMPGNKSEIRDKFLAPKGDRQLTTSDRRSTTNSPSKNHALHLIFAKTPSKNAQNHPKNKSVNP
jgi:hypothetical protein